ncbi:hypothetical protein [Paenibacillus agilis]|uniref:Uncharacterized protein n=1 Tax=Paenibacillus agilis TaxID=3020863 RepID=A0A559IY10_9BACL|nr:hypothetical protein [Paenibacillus agilis]TVX92503.1 hypothetical protein FPZ44_05205 [Paenibacillus agilis]
MKLVEQWIFPVPSSCISTTLSLAYKQGDAVLLFDYYDEEQDDTVFNGGIKFISTVSHRHSSEKFTKYISGTYDKLVKIENSNWVSELMEISPEWVIDDLCHFAIYLDSYGLYEFVSQDFCILESKEGAICNEG